MNSSRAVDKMWKTGQAHYGVYRLQRPFINCRYLQLEFFYNYEYHEKRFIIRDNKQNRILACGVTDLLEPTVDKKTHCEFNNSNRINLLLQYVSDERSIKCIIDNIAKNSISIRYAVYDALSMTDFNNNLIAQIESYTKKKRNAGDYDITFGDIKYLYSLCSERPAASQKCKLRKEDEAIFNLNSKQIVAKMPSWRDVSDLLSRLLSWVNYDWVKKANPIVIAAIFQYIFLKIHPFTDGNGRVARALYVFLISLRSRVKVNFSGYLSNIGIILQEVFIRGDIDDWVSLCYQLSTTDAAKSFNPSLVTNRKVYISQRTKKNMNLKNIVLGSLIAVTLALGIGISGHVHDSWNNVPGANSLVRVFRKPSGGSIDTLLTNTNSNTRWTIFTENFSPPAGQGDTLYIEAEKDTLGRKFNTKTKWVIRSGVYPNHNYVKELHLDDPFNSPLAFTPNISVVKDTSGISSSFVALAWLYKNQNQKCIGVVDTALSLFHRYDVFINLEKQDSTFTQGDSFRIHLEKIRNDTIWFTEIASAIDTTDGNAMLVNATNSVHNGAFHGDSLYFPQGFTVFKDIGIEQILVPDSSDSGQVINPGVIIRNYGTINQDPKLHCKINEFYHDSINVVAHPGIDTFYFSPCTLSQVGNWLVTSYSILPGDVNPSNDTLQDTITVNPVGIKENQKKSLESKFNIYPTVSSGNIFNTNYRGKVNIFDESGRKVGTSMIQDGKLNLVYLPAGVYFIKPEENSLPTRKVVKTR